MPRVRRGSLLEYKLMGDFLAEAGKTLLSTDRLNWVKAQDLLKQIVVLEDDFSWTLPAREPCTEKNIGGENLQYIGGVDISFSKDNADIACGAFVVLDIDSLNVVYDDFSVVKLETPYVPGFLAFREVPVLLDLLQKMKQCGSPFYPQLLMVDGNGILHPRGCGLACHLGILADIPTIGIGKNLHHVDGLTISGVKRLFEADSSSGGKDLVTLIGNSGREWGVAMKSTDGSTKPIFLSIGHRISLQTAIKVTKMCCRFRVPEPIRQADIRSRAYLLQKHGRSI